VLCITKSRTTRSDGCSRNVAQLPVCPTGLLPLPTSVSQIAVSFASIYKRTAEW
jgi:hypothetical protein